MNLESFGQHAKVDLADGKMFVVIIYTIIVIVIIPIIIVVVIIPIINAIVIIPIIIVFIVIKALFIIQALFITKTRMMNGMICCSVVIIRCMSVTR